MKKAISLIFALLIGLMLVACGEKETSQEVKQESGIQVQTQQNNSNLTFSKTASIEKTVIYDQDNIRITANSLTYTNYGAEIELAFENNTDENLSFVSGSLGYSCNAVNGYMMRDGYFYCDVPAGKQAIDSLYIGYESMLLCGINEIKSIQIGIDISDESYEDVYVAPIELLTSAQGGSDSGFYESVQNTDLQNGLGIKVEKSYQENISLCSGVAALSEVVLTSTSDAGQLLLLEIENQTNEAVYVSADRISVNGLLIESNTWTGDIINAGKRDLLAIELKDIMDGSSLQSYGITEAGEVSLRLVAEDLQSRELGQVQFTMPIIDGAKRVTANGEALYDKNGIRIYAGAMTKDSGSYSNDIHIFLLVENGSGADISVSDDYGSLSLNGYMADYFCPFVTVPNDAIAELDISISEDDAEKIGISSESDIRDMEMRLSIEDGKYRQIDEPLIELAW